MSALPAAAIHALDQHSSHSSPASSSNVAPVPSNEPAIAYDPKPPKWRSRLHPGSSKVGYPDFYLPRKDAPEHDLSEQNVRKGIVSAAPVANESFSAHSIFLGQVSQILSPLNQLFCETLKRRELLESGHSVQAHSYRAPSRVTLNEIKLATYVRDLADSTVPLSRLSKNIPHGFRGERMLEMLWQGAVPVGLGGASNASSASMAAHAVKMAQSLSAASRGESSVANSGDSLSPKSVEIARAVWFVRTVGASDLATRSRTATAISSTAYTFDFTNIYTTWLKKQLQDLPLVSKTADTSSRPSKEALIVWASKWRYSLLLMNELLSEALLDEGAWLTFVASAYSTADLPRLPFLLSFVQDWLCRLLEHDQLTISIAIATAEHLAALARSRHPFGEELTRQLCDIVKMIWQRSPDDLVSPRLWLQHKDIVEKVIKQAFTNPRTDQLLSSIERRSLGFLSDTEGSKDSSLSFIRQLDGFAGLVDSISSLTGAFEQEQQDAGFTQAVRQLIEWSTTSHRPSQASWRPLLAAHLLRTPSLGLQSRKAAKRKQGVDLNQLICSWIEDSDHRQDSSATKQGLDFDRLVLLLAELIRLDLFSYPRFLHRLTAQGLTFGTGSNSSQDDIFQSLQMRLLRVLPVPDMSASLAHQRRLALYGPRTKETREEASHRRALRELSGVLSFLGPADPVAQGNGPSEQQVYQALPHLWSASPHVRHRIMSEHVLPSATQWLETTQAESSSEVAMILWLFMQAGIDHPLEAVCISAMKGLLSRVEPASWTTRLRLLKTVFCVRRKAFLATDACTMTLVAVKALVVIILKHQDADFKSIADWERSLENFSTGDLLILDQLIEACARLESTREVDGKDEIMTDSDPTTQDEKSRVLPNLHLQSEDAVNTFESIWKHAEPLDENNASEAIEQGLSTLLQAAQSNTLNLDDAFAEWARAHHQDLQLESVRTAKLFRIVLPALLQVGVLSASSVIQNLVQVVLDGQVQTLNSSTGAQSAVETSSILDSVSGLLVLLVGSQRDLPTASEVTIEGRLAMQASMTLVAPEAILQLVSTLSTMRTHSSSIDKETEDTLRKIVVSLLHLDRVTDALTLQPALLSDSLRQARKNVWGDSLESARFVFSSLDEETLLLTPPLDLDLNVALERADRGRLPFLVEELAFIFEALATSDASQQSRAESKIAKCAQMLFDSLYLSDKEALASGLRLWNTGGRSYQEACVQKGWTLMLDALNQSREDSIRSVHAALSALARQDAALSLSAPSDFVLLNLLNHLDGYLACLFDLGSTTNNVSSIQLRLQVLGLVLQSLVAWTAGIRSAVSSILTRLLRLCTRYVQCESRPDEISSTLLRDAISHLQAQVPPDALASIWQTIRTEDFLRLEADSLAIRDLRRLLPPSASSTTPASNLIVAPSSKQLYISAQTVDLAVDNPWRWSDAIDTVISEADGPNGKANHLPDRWALHNNTSLSLASFAPVRTRQLPLNPGAEYRAVTSIRNGFPRLCAGDDEEEGWRCIASERVRVQEDPLRPSLSPLMANGSVDQAWSSAKDINSQSELASSIGLPVGPLRTLESYRKAQAENALVLQQKKQAAEGSRGGRAAPKVGRGKTDTSASGSRKRKEVEVVDLTSDTKARAGGYATGGRAKKRAN